MVKHTQPVCRQIKQFVGNLPINCLSVFDHLVGLALKGLGKICEWFWFVNVK